MHWLPEKGLLKKRPWPFSSKRLCLKLPLSFLLMMTQKSRELRKKWRNESFVWKQKKAFLPRPSFVLPLSTSWIFFSRILLRPEMTFQVFKKVFLSPIFTVFKDHRKNIIMFEFSCQKSTNLHHFGRKYSNRDFFFFYLLCMIRKE